MNLLLEMCIKEQTGVLEDVFVDSKIVRTQNLDQVRGLLEAEETLPQIPALV